MSRITLVVVPDPELFGERRFPVVPSAQVFSVLAQMSDISKAIGQLTQQLNAGLASLNEVRSQLELPAVKEE